MLFYSLQFFQLQVLFFLQGPFLDSYLLGGDFKYCLFLPQTLGKGSNLTTIFQMGGSTTTIGLTVSCAARYDLRNLSKSQPAAIPPGRKPGILSEGSDPGEIEMGVSKNIGTPKWMVKIMENPIKMDDLGVLLFLETPKYEMNHYTLINYDSNGKWTPWSYSSYQQWGFVCCYVSLLEGTPPLKLTPSHKESSLPTSILNPNVRANPWNQ